MDLRTLELAIRKAMQESTAQPALAGIAAGGIGDVRVSAEFSEAARTLGSRTKSGAANILQSKMEGWN